MPPKKYLDFIEGAPVYRRGKHPPHTERAFVDIRCPNCDNVFVELPQEHVASSKASYCKKHLLKCASNPETVEAPKKKPRHTTGAPYEEDGLVTIYKIVYLPEDRAVYTGRTKDMHRRMQQHASVSSGCRLVRNAMRRHGRKSFAVEPIMWCHSEDADANESFWIIENQTMHPRGYNLRHGSMAGAESEHPSALMRTSQNVIPFQGARDEARAMRDAWDNVFEMLEADENGEQADGQLRELLREVHPDRAGDRVYSADEVAAMLNSVRESLAQ